MRRSDPRVPALPWLLLAGCAAGEIPSDGDPPGIPLDTDPPSDPPDADGFYGRPPAIPWGAPRFSAAAQDGTPRDRSDLYGRATALWFYPNVAGAN